MVYFCATLKADTLMFDLLLIPLMIKCIFIPIGSKTTLMPSYSHKVGEKWLGSAGVQEINGDAESY